jgi:hypothetical protein
MQWLALPFVVLAEMDTQHASLKSFLHREASVHP